MKYEKSCGAVVYIKDENKIKYLIIRHKNGGHWGFPKGHIESGESEEAAATREILEETGLEVKLIGDFKSKTLYSPYENVMKEVIFFLANSLTKNIQIQEQEILDYNWGDVENILDLLTYEDDKRVLNEANDYILESN